MLENETKRKRKPRSRFVAFAIVVIPILIACCLLCLPVVLFASPSILGDFQVMLHQRQWYSKGISSYTLTVERVEMAAPPPITIRVVDGQVVEAIKNEENIPISDAIRSLTIESLFTRAFECIDRWTCSVQYDEVYGYPAKLGGGFIESSWIVIKDFQPIFDE